MPASYKPTSVVSLKTDIRILFLCMFRFPCEVSSTFFFSASKEPLRHRLYRALANRGSPDVPRRKPCVWAPRGRSPVIRTTLENLQRKRRPYPKGSSQLEAEPTLLQLPLLDVRSSSSSKEEPLRPHSWLAIVSQAVSQSNSSTRHPVSQHYSWGCCYAPSTHPPTPPTPPFPVRQSTHPRANSLWAECLLWKIENASLVIWSAVLRVLVILCEGER